MDNEVTDQNNDDLNKRIPTYLLQKTKNGLEFIGNGYFKDCYPSLVFLRGKEYRFLFKDEASLIDLVDSEGNVLRTSNLTNTTQPLILTLGNNFPNKIFYRLKSDEDSTHGVILLRDLDKITGKVMTYGYAKGASVTDNKHYDLQTDDNGNFSLYFTNSGKYFYTLDLDLYASGGFDSLATDVFDVQTYSSMSLFNLKTIKGSLILNTFTTLYYFLSKRFLRVDYKHLNKKICEYFKLSPNYDILTDDPIVEFMQNNLKISDYAQLIIFTSVVEFIASQPNRNLEDLFYESTVNEILQGNEKFDPNNIRFIKDNDSITEYDMFKSASFVFVTKIDYIIKQNRKKDCILEDLLSLVHKFRLAIIDKDTSYELFLKSDLQLTTGKLKLPIHSKIVLLSFLDNCKIASFGKYAKINLTDQFLSSILNQNLPFESEIVNKLIGKIVYFKDALNNFFCYKIVDFINYDYDLPEIKIENMVQSFDEENLCCELENIINDPKQKSEDDPVEETEIMDLILFNGDKENILNLSITNKDKPFDQINLTNIFYINEFLPTTTKYIPPMFIGINKKYSQSVGNVEISFDTLNTNYDIDKIRYDYGTIKIKNINISDDILEFKTKDQHEFEVGDSIILQNTSKSGVLDGTHVVVNKTENTFAIKINVDKIIPERELIGVYGEVLSKRFSKIYCDVNDFSKEDKLIFSKSANIKEDIIVHDIRQDYLGKFLLVNSILPKDLNIFSKKEDITDKNEKLMYKQETDAVYYNIPNLDLEKYDLWVYTPMFPGQALRSRIDSFISQIKYDNAVSQIGQINKTNSFLRVSDNSQSDGETNTIESVVGETENTENSTPTPTPINNVSDESINNEPPTSSENTNDISLKILQELNVINELPNTLFTDFADSNISLPQIDIVLPMQNSTEVYNSNRKYLREEFEVGIGDELYDEVYDWNGDGVINEDELKILERYILTRPSSVEEYNEFRGDYPVAKLLPTIATATYACQDYCCHDDFTQTENFNEEDVYIYDAFQTYISSLDENAESEFANFLYEYSVLEKQGLTPSLSNDIVYMPTDPRQYNLCADYTKNEIIDSDDANIYYAYQLYNQANSEQPTSVAQFKTYYNSLVVSGIVPTLLQDIKVLPSLPSDTEIVSDTGTISKGCNEITWKDGKIYDEWLRQEKPVDIDEFNANRLGDVPRACFLPIEGDPGFGDYDEFGDIGFTFANNRESGVINL